VWFSTKLFNRWAILAAGRGELRLAAAFCSLKVVSGQWREAGVPVNQELEGPKRLKRPAASNTRRVLGARTSLSAERRQARKTLR
jgi:hypothetical protein